MNHFNLCYLNFLITFSAPPPPQKSVLPASMED